MDAVLVELRARGPGGGSTIVTLAPGASASFGRCGCGRCGLDIVVPGQGVPRRAGRITASDDHWRLTNLSRVCGYVVEHLEDSGQYISVAPGRLRAPIPFDLSRIVLPGVAPDLDLMVFAGWDQPADAAPDEAECPCEPTVASFRLDTAAKYFLVLVALCEPRLRSAAAADVPTAREIVGRLRALPACRDLTESAVQFHIDYLATEKLRLAPPEDRGPNRVGWKRLALATAAMRHGLVRSEHLGMLPARRRAVHR